MPNKSTGHASMVVGVIGVIIKVLHIAKYTPGGGKGRREGELIFTDSGQSAANYTFYTATSAKSAADWWLLCATGKAIGSDFTY